MISINREELLRCLTVVCAVIPNRTVRPILQNVLLSILAETAFLEATDGEMAISCEIDGAIPFGNIEMLIPAAKLRAILSASNAETVTLVLHGGKVKVQCGSSEFVLPTEDAASFPRFPAKEDGSLLKVSVADMRTGVRRTVFATDDESARYALGGVKFDLSDGLTLVATDSRRLAMQSMNCSLHDRVDGSIVVPEKAMAVVGKMLPDDGEVEIGINHQCTAVEFRSNGFRLSTRLVEGRFPKWQDVVPQHGHIRHRIEVNVGWLLSAVRQAAITTSQETRGVRFSFKPGVGVMLGSEAADVGSASIEVSIAECDTDMTIVLDPTFLREFLQVLPQESAVTLCLTDGESAVLLQAEDGDCRYVVMPLCPN